MTWMSDTKINEIRIRKTKRKKIEQLFNEIFDELLFVSLGKRKVRRRKINLGIHSVKRISNGDELIWEMKLKLCDWKFAFGWLAVVYRLRPWWRTDKRRKLKVETFSYFWLLRNLLTSPAQSFKAIDLRERLKLLSSISASKRYQFFLASLNR